MRPVSLGGVVIHKPVTRVTGARSMPSAVDGLLGTVRSTASSDTPLVGSSILLDRSEIPGRRTINQLLLSGVVIA